MSNFSSRIFARESYFDSHSTLPVVCATTALSYIAPKLVGMLVSNPQTVWPLWPGCAILVTGLLLVRASVWPLLIVLSFGGFALADLQAGVPRSSIASFIPGNTVEVLISAIGLRYCFDGVPRLNSVKAFAKYALFAVVFAPLAGAFLSAHGVARDYWTGWEIVFLSEALAFITLTPALLSWISEGRAWIRKSRAYHVEAVALTAGLIVVSYIVFTLPENARSPALFYMLVPFLLWSALRFGWLGISNSLIVVTSLSIWGAIEGKGPFSNLVLLTNPLPLQMFLVVASVPFMILAALAEEQQQAVLEVSESEERFRLVSNTAPVMIRMAGTNRLCTYVNQRWLEFTGRPLESELGNGWTDGIHKKDLKRCLEAYSLAFEQRQSLAIEYRVRRHDGEYRWILDTGVPRFNPDGSFAGYIRSCLDITDRKLAEEALATMGRRLIEAHEEERTWIARELHDDIVQRVTLVAIELERCGEQAADATTAVHDGIRRALERVSDLGKDIQSLSHHLHSSKLEYLGFVSAAQSFCRELSEQRSVRIEFNHSNIPATVPKEISLCLFRVLQEALQNGVKHSGVQDFAVEVHGTEGEIRLTVSDSGVGFNSRLATNRGGLGLVSMRERLRLVDGELTIHSEPGRGTTVVALVPNRHEEQPMAIAG